MAGLGISESWWSKDTIAVVTGANKGIGTEIVRLLAEQGLTVVLTARDQARGQAAVDALKKQGLESVVFHQLEVCRLESIQKFAKWLKTEYGGIDILVNNAAIYDIHIAYKTAKEIIETNYYGVRKVTEGLLPLLRASLAGARIVNVSSRVGLYERLAGESLKDKFKNEDNYSNDLADSLATQYLDDVKAGRADEKDWPWVPVGKTPVYSDSKIILNVHAIALAKSLLKLQPDNHKIFLVSFCPGATQTDMADAAFEGGDVKRDEMNVKTAAEGADTGVWLALLPKEELAEKAGKFFGERTEYPFGWVNPPM